MAKKTVADIDVKGKRVLMRVDFNVPQHDDGTVRLWDVRPAGRQDEDFRLKVRLTAEACVEVGWSHEVFAGWSRIRRVNLMWIHGFRRPMPWYQGSLRLLHECLEGQGSVADVLGLDAGGGHVLSAMWHGIWSGQIECDLDAQLTRTTPSVVHQPEAVTA